jgi:hypothetical protein
MKESRFIKIKDIESKFDGKPRYEVINKRGDYVLGDIYYFSGWRQYIFAPYEDSEYNSECLSTIVSWLNELNKKSK